MSLVTKRSTLVSESSPTNAFVVGYCKMFENLTNKFEEIFSSLKKAPSLSEKQVDDGLKNIRVALLEADVALPVAKKLIENMSIAKFRRTCPDAKGYRGEEINIEGRPAVLANVYGSRVRVDFNPGLAGKELVFKYTVKAVLKKPIQKIKALFAAEYPLEDDFEVIVEKKVAE